jgi:O-antigen/teichoic acid export membrane protein
VVTVMVGLLGPWLAASVGEPLLEPLLWLLPPVLLLFGLSQPLSYWQIRRGAFRVNAVNRLVQASGQSVPQVAFGFAGLGAPGLILGYILGYVARLAHLLMALPRSDWALLKQMRPDRIRRLARRHWRYPIFSTLSTLCISSTQLLPPILFAMLYDPAVAGWFGLGQRLLATPVRMVSQAASQVYLAEVPQLRDNRAIHRLFIKASTGFLGLGLLGMTPLLLFAPPLFALVFGPGWREAGVMVQLLVPFHLVRFIVMPVSQTLNMFERQDLHMVAALLSGLSLGLSFAAGWWLGLSPLGTVALYSAGATAAQLLYFLMAWRVVRTARVLPAARGIDTSGEA